MRRHSSRRYPLWFGQLPLHFGPPCSAAGSESCFSFWCVHASSKGERSPCGSQQVSFGQMNDPCRRIDAESAFAGVRAIIRPHPLSPYPLQMEQEPQGGHFRTSRIFIFSSNAIFRLDFRVIAFRLFLAEINLQRLVVLTERKQCFLFP
jgi:hypothetical protein